MPPGFAASTLPITPRSQAPAPNWINGLWRPTTIDFASDGKLFVAEWVGRVKVFDSLEETDLQAPHLSVDITDDVHGSGDRGLLGMKLDPEFGTDGHNYIYLLYAYDALPGNEDAPIHEQYIDGGDKCNYSAPSECVVSGRLVRIELDPETGIAVGGAGSPTQHVLVESWCQQYNSHSIGDIEFDSTGALLASAGEGANYTTADYGQFENPCADPVGEGGSLRAQDVRTSADTTDYSGSIIRIDRNTGAALSDNPLYKNPANPSVDNPDVRARRLLAYGLRNPYRIEIRPQGDSVYIGDVGQDKWDELNRVPLPPAPGQALNFGWPCYEGASGVLEVQPNWDALNKPLCESLYSSPGSVTPSVFAYGHGATSGPLFAGDACDPSPGTAPAGLMFYDPAGVAAGDQFPAQYDGALFMADAARGCIWAMAAGAGGKPDPTMVTNFAVPDEESGMTPVDLVEGPEGAMFAPDVNGNSIWQIRYFPGQQPPEAALEASKTDGTIGSGFEVQFDAGASTDPDGDSLHYEWDLDGDGKFDDGEDAASVEHTYTTSTNVTVKVRVSDPFNFTDVAQVKLYPGDLGPPVPKILAPVENLNWAIGDTINYGGSATDPDGDTVGNGLILHWVFNVRHCPNVVNCHTHALSQSDSPSGKFVAPPHEYPSHLMFELTATDDRGRSVTVSRDVFPKVIQIGISSDPVGVPVTIEGLPPEAGPLMRIAGGSATVTAPESAVIGGQSYTFESWSDGGAPVHEVTSRDSLSLVARYRPTALTPEVKLPAPIAGKFRISLSSRPPGARLTLGTARKRSPFALELAGGTVTAVAAPAGINLKGRRFAFKEWKVDGRKLTKKHRAGVVVERASRYLAIFKPKALRRSRGASAAESSVD